MSRNFKTGLAWAGLIALLVGGLILSNICQANSWKQSCIQDAIKRAQQEDGKAARLVRNVWIYNGDTLGIPLDGGSNTMHCLNIYPGHPDYAVSKKLHKGARVELRFTSSCLMASHATNEAAYLRISRVK